MQELRVAWITDIFDELSGVVTDSIEFNELAHKKGVAWYPITCYPKKLEPFHCFKHMLKVPSGGIYKGSNLYVPDFMEIVLYCRKHRINLIVSNTPSVMGLTAMALARYLNVPWVDIYHTDVDFYLKILTGRISSLFIRPALYYVKLYHKRADLIFVRTKEYHDLMIKKGHPSSKIRPYPAGINISRFHPKNKDLKIWEPLNIDSEKIIVLFVGRVTKVKDIVFLLDVFDQENLNHCELVLIGDGPERAEYEKRYGGQNNIHFLGKRTGDELLTLYASSDLYVLPSASETLGKTVLEAMASEVPALVSDKGGPKDYITDGYSGHVFNASKYTAFKEKFLEVIDNKHELEEMGKRARVEISEYTDTKLFDKFILYIKQLL